MRPRTFDERIATHAQAAAPVSMHGRNRLASGLADPAGRGTPIVSSPGNQRHDTITLEAAAHTLDDQALLWSSYQTGINTPIGLGATRDLLDAGTTRRIKATLTGPASLGGWIRWTDWRGCTSITVNQYRDGSLLATDTIEGPDTGVTSLTTWIVNDGQEWTVQYGDEIELVPDGTAGGRDVAAASLVWTQSRVTSALPDVEDPAYLAAMTSYDLDTDFTFAPVYVLNSAGAELRSIDVQMDPAYGTTALFALAVDGSGGWWAADHVGVDPDSYASIVEIDPSDGTILTRHEFGDYDKYLYGMHWDAAAGRMIGQQWESTSGPTLVHTINLTSGAVDSTVSAAIPSETVGAVTYNRWGIGLVVIDGDVWMPIFASAGDETGVARINASGAVVEVVEFGDDDGYWPSMEGLSYDATNGRWLVSDPSGDTGDGANDVHVYVYASDGTFIQRILTPAVGQAESIAWLGG